MKNALLIALVLILLFLIFNQKTSYAGCNKNTRCVSNNDCYGGKCTKYLSGSYCYCGK